MTGDKKAFRSAVREKQKNLSEEYIALSNRLILEALVSMPEIRETERLFLYYSVGREIDTRELIAWCEKENKTVFLPVTQEGGRMRFVRYDGFLKEGKYFSIPEPTDNGEEAFPGKNDVMIVPGLCFDAGGGRMGKGAGYYDRYLAENPCVTVGLCREKMLCDSVPVQEHDIPVAFVVTEKEVRGR